jgi:hypothetical protein
MIRTTFGKILSFLYSTVEASSEAASTGSSILVSMAPGSVTKSNSIIAYSFGILNGIVTWITSYSIQGVEIRRRFSDETTSEQNEADYDPIEEISRRRQSAYLSLKYGYIASALVVDFLDICLLYSAAKAWRQDLQDNGNQPLTFISHSEAALLFLYYCLFDLPFIFSIEIPQTCKQILESIGLSSENAPDHFIMEKLQNLIRPIARRNLCRKTIRMTGSIADMGEHMLPLILIIPPSWILDLLKQPTFLIWGATAASALMLIVISSTILTQTYLFEGKICENNLEAIAEQFGDQLDEEVPWINPRLSKAFHKLLYFGGPLHGIDIWLSILLTLREVEAPEALIHITSLAAFFIGWMGNHYSEVMASQESLKRITKHIPEELPLVAISNGRTQSPIFTNGHYEVSNVPRAGFEKIPVQILNYRTPSTN